MDGELQTEALLNLLSSADFRDAVHSFFAAHASVFTERARDGSSQHRRHEVWLEYGALVESLVASALHSLGGSIESLEEGMLTLVDCDARGPRQELAQTLVRRLLSCHSYIAFEEQMHSHNTLTRSTVRGDQHEESFPLAEEADLRDALTRMGFQGALVEAVLGEPSKTKTRTVESLVERLSELLEEGTATAPLAHARCFCEATHTDENSLTAALSLAHSLVLESSACAVGLEALLVWAGAVVDFETDLSDWYTRSGATRGGRSPALDALCERWTELVRDRRAIEQSETVSNGLASACDTLYAGDCSGTDDERMLQDLLHGYHMLQQDLRSMYRRIAVVARSENVPRNDLEELYLFLKDKVGSGESLRAAADEMHRRVALVAGAQDRVDVVGLLLDVHLVEEQLLSTKRNIQLLLGTDDVDVDVDGAGEGLSLEGVDARGELGEWEQRRRDEAAVLLHALEASGASEGLVQACMRALDEQVARESEAVEACGRDELSADDRRAVAMQTARGITARRANDEHSLRVAALAAVSCFSTGTYRDVGVVVENCLAVASAFARQGSEQHSCDKAHTDSGKENQARFAVLVSDAYIDMLDQSLLDRTKPRLGASKADTAMFLDRFASHANRAVSKRIDVDSLAESMDESFDRRRLADIRTRSEAKSSALAYELSARMRAQAQRLEERLRVRSVGRTIRSEEIERLDAAVMSMQEMINYAEPEDLARIDETLLLAALEESTQGRKFSQRMAQYMRIAEEKEARNELAVIRTTFNATSEQLSQAMVEQMRAQKLRLEDRLSAKRGAAESKDSKAVLWDTTEESERLNEAFSAMSSMLRSSNKAELQNIDMDALCRALEEHMLGAIELPRRLQAFYKDTREALLRSEARQIASTFDEEQNKLALVLRMEEARQRQGLQKKLLAKQRQQIASRQSASGASDTRPASDSENSQSDTRAPIKATLHGSGFASRGMSLGPILRK